ncbi:MAG: hypothetical protein U9R75_12470 [Candidatus Thermoplasmatota archaeon]|nr:hypothetical protein [Candidatus Thermoplasmatota archaeon]
MIEVEIEKLGHPDLEMIEGLLGELKKSEAPPFSGFDPDMDAITDAVKRISSSSKIVIIGHGGSITTFKGILNSVGRRGDREFHLIDTVDPEYIGYVKKRCDRSETHVIAISKSGNTLTVLEVLSIFDGYSTIVITEPGYGTLRKLAKRKEWTIVDVPTDIGGRFSGITASALLPALVLGIDVNAFVRGMKEAYIDARKKDDMVNLSGAFYMIERMGKRTIFMPVYSKGYSAFNDLVTQLFHETLSKGRKGLTMLTYEGPECQHHTNQRVLDGPEDVATLFITVDGEEGEQVSWSGVDIEYKGVPMSEMGPYSLKKAMLSEARGVMGSMDDIKAPYAVLKIKGEDERAVGYYVGMVQYLAYYFALLRRVNPFDQPAVEKAKEIAMEIRKGT